MKLLQTYFLPLGLLAATAAGLLFPSAGQISAEFHLGGLFSSSWLIIMVFLVSGYQFKLSDLPDTPLLAKTGTAALVINLLLAPLLAWIFLQRVNQDFALGLWTIMIVPTTLSSGIVISRQAGGNTALAVILTLVLSCAGLISMSILNFPIQSSLILPHFIHLSGIVLTPLLIGMLIRKFWKNSNSNLLKLIPSLCIIALVWMSVSTHIVHIAAIKPDFIIKAVFLSLDLHLLLYFSAHVTGKMLQLSQKNLISLRFVSSQKTLPLALLLLSSGSSENHFFGLAVAFCLIFHFIQITVDSLLAARLNTQTSSNQVQ